MTSKTLFFKFLKKDLAHRLWAVALVGLGCFFAYPVMAAMEAGKISTFLTVEEGLQYYNKSMQYMNSFGNGLTVFITMVAALVCGMSSFSYLNSRNKVDFYHSLPIRRELMFGASFLGGILILAVPFALSLVAAALVAVGNGADASALWPLVWSGMGLHLIYFLLMYGTVVLAMIMTGNLVVAFLGYMVFCFLVPLTAVLIQGYFMVFFKTFMVESFGSLFETAIRFSPVMEYLYAVEYYTKQDPAVVLQVVKILAISGALAFLGGYLYRERPSEAAGKALAFEVTKPVIRVILVLFCSLGMSVLFLSMQQGSRGWAVFGAVCGAVISHGIIEVIYNFDFKKLFSHPIQLAGCIGVSILILLTFHYDWLGYDRYLPEASRVQSGFVNIDSLSHWVSYGGTKKREDGAYIWEQPEEDWPFYTTPVTDVDEILKLAEAGIADLDAENPDGARFERINIAYQLKNGKMVYRSYYMNVDKNAQLLQALFEQESFQQSVFPLLSRDAASVAEVGYRRGGGKEEIRLTDLTQEERAQLLETYQEEFKGLTLETMKQESPAGLIRFYSEPDLEAIAWWKREEGQHFRNYPYLQGYYRYEMIDQDFYPVYPSFHKTSALLKQHGIQLGDYYDVVTLDSVRIIEYPDDGSMKQIKVTEPEEMEAMKKVMTIPGIGYYNDLLESENLEITVWISGEEEHQFSVNIPKGNLPEFAARRLEEAKPEIW